MAWRRLPVQLLGWVNCSVEIGFTYIVDDEFSCLVHSFIVANLPGWFRPNGFKSMGLEKIHEVDAET